MRNSYSAVVSRRTITWSAVLADGLVGGSSSPGREVLADGLVGGSSSPGREVLADGLVGGALQVVDVSVELRFELARAPLLLGHELRARRVGRVHRLVKQTYRLYCYDLGQHKRGGVPVYKLC